MRSPLDIYRLLIKLYPAGFRERFGSALERQFQDDYGDAHGRRARAGFWARTLLDVVGSMPRQYAAELAQDARYTLRLWRARPIHTAFAVAILAIAVGANTGVFSVLNALLLRSLPFHQPERLAALKNFGAPRNEFHTWRAERPYLADAATYTTFDVNVESAGQTRRLRLAETSFNFFSLLGREPVMGRGFAAGEDVPGRDAVAVISYGLWQRLYGAGAAVLGAPVVINGSRLTIVGVAPPGFDYPQQSDLWTPTTFDFELIPKTGSVLMWSTIGRLKDGVTWPQARQAFEAEARQRSPERQQMDEANRAALLPLQQHLAGQVRKASLLLMAGVGLLLLLACANLSNLLLARTVARSHELTLRRALGASRGRLAQQLLTETMLLSVAAGTAGLLVAYWTVRVAALAQPPQLALQSYEVLDARVLAFSVAVTMITGLVFGVGPALYANRAPLTLTARTATASVRHARTRAVLIGVQVAVTVVLLTGSLALGRAFLGLLHVDGGYDVRSIATFSVSLAGTRYEAGESASAYYERLLHRLRELPGVQAVSATQSVPLGTDAFAGGRFNVENVGPLTLAPVISIRPGFFQAMGGHIVAGREFTDDDPGDTAVVVSEAFAKAYGHPAQLLGRHVTADRRPALQIIGVVRGLRYGAAISPDPQIFTVGRAPRATTVVVQVAGDAADRLDMVRAAAQAVDPAVPVFDVRTMAQRLDATLARPQFYATAVTFFGGLAVLLAVVGIYGIVSFAVAQRTREMGIRLALGTTSTRVRGVLLGRTLTTILCGAAIGSGVVLAGGQYLQSLIAGAEQHLLPATAAAVTLVAAIGGTAVWLASRAIARFAIADVLRAEAAE